MKNILQVLKISSKVGLILLKLLKTNILVVPSLAAALSNFYIKRRAGLKRMTQNS